MPSYRKLLCSLLLLSAGASSYAATHTHAPIPTPIIIGAIYNLSGPQSSLDIASAKGAEFAIKEINANGGIKGHPLELILKNGKTEKATITEAAKQLANNPEISVIIGLSDTDMAAAAIPPIAAAHKLFITSGATGPTLPKLAPGYVFLTCFSDNAQAAAGAEYAYDKLKGKTAYLLVEKNMEFARLLGQSFKMRYNKLGGQIVAEVNFDQPTQVATQLVKLKAESTATPAVIYIAAGPEKSIEVVKAIRQANLKQPIIGGDSFDLEDLLKKVSEIADPFYFTAHAFLTPQNTDPRVKQFIKHYQTTYPNLSVSSFTGLGYDAVNLVAKAISQAPSTKPAAIRAALLKINHFNGVTGTLSYHNNNPIPLKTVSIIKLQKDGELRLAEKLTLKTQE